ncbi:MAG TPA: sugar-binding domain-containing protein [Candidatus Limnocylindrales bacterium]|jgi:DNA-binding transcriptional regulator LsrR (DeoR family)
MTDQATLVQVSRLYYEGGETQERIATLLGVTRPHVSKLLKEARARGVVEIRVVDDEQATPLADRLRSRFGLRAVHLAPAIEGDAGAARHRLGRLAAEVLRGVVRDGHVVGIGAGSSISAVAEAMPSGAAPVDATVVPLCGGFWVSSAGPEPFRRIAESLGSTSRALLAPGVLESAATRDALWEDPGIRAVRDLWGHLDVALVGVGGPTWSDATVGGESLRELQIGQAIGELLIQPFDAAGRFVAPGFTARTVAFDAARLRGVPTAIAVAAGAGKVRPLRATLLAGLFGVVVTDVPTAAAILAADGAAP